MVLRRDGAGRKTPYECRDGAGADPQCTGMVPGCKTSEAAGMAPRPTQCTGMVPGCKTPQ